LNCGTPARHSRLALKYRRGSSRKLKMQNAFIWFDSQILGVLRIQEDLNEKSEIRQIANLILLHFSCTIA